MSVELGCSICGDRCGWRIWQSLNFTSGKMEYIWEQCQECNADGLKPKVELCKQCGETPALCACDSVSKMD